MDYLSSSKLISLCYVAVETCESRRFIINEVPPSRFTSLCATYGFSTFQSSPSSSQVAFEYASKSSGSPSNESSLNQSTEVPVQAGSNQSSCSSGFPKPNQMQFELTLTSLNESNTKPFYSAKQTYPERSKSKWYVQKLAIYMHK